MDVCDLNYVYSTKVYCMMIPSDLYFRVSYPQEIKEIRAWLHATGDLLPAFSTTRVITALSLEPVRQRGWIQGERMLSTEPVTNGAELRTATPTAVAERDSTQMSRQ